MRPFKWSKRHFLENSGLAHIWLRNGSEWLRMALFLFCRSEWIQIWHRWSLSGVKYIFYISALIFNFSAPKWLRNGSEWLFSCSVAQISFKFGTDDPYQLSGAQIMYWCSLSIFWLRNGFKMVPKWLRMALFLFCCSVIIQIWYRWSLLVK